VPKSGVRSGSTPLCSDLTLWYNVRRHAGADLKVVLNKEGTNI